MNPRGRPTEIQIACLESRAEMPAFDSEIEQLLEEEAISLYKSIGLEVHLEPAQAKDLACSECQSPQPSATVEGWYVIYTRPKVGAESAPDETDELW